MHTQKAALTRAETRVAVRHDARRIAQREGHALWHFAKAWIVGGLMADGGDKLRFFARHVASGVDAVDACVADGPAPECRAEPDIWRFCVLRLDGSGQWMFYGVVEPITPNRIDNFGFRIGWNSVADAVVVGTWSTAVASLFFPQGANRLEGEAFAMARYFAEPFTPTVVPEPSTLTLLALPVVHLLTRRRRRRERA